MAAIWGIINRNPKNESSDAEKLFTKMGNSMSGFPIDRIDTVNCTTGFFACGHQYLTNEDQSDVSPITDNDSQVIFCSDCFLYNRDYLIKELNDSSLINAGDSLLAYNAFKHWGYSFVEKLRGNFSFAIYEINTGCLHLFTDHLSKQYLTYSVLSDYIMFSTIYKPILACLDGKEKINREFIINRRIQKWL